MKNKKYIMIGIILIIIVAIIFGMYKIAKTYLFEPNGIKIYKRDSSKLINHIKSIENEIERKNQIDFWVEQNILTQQEANELY